MAQRPLAAQAGVIKGRALLLLLHVLQGGDAQRQSWVDRSGAAAVAPAGAGGIGGQQPAACRGHGGLRVGLARTLGWMSTARREFMQ